MTLIKTFGVALSAAALLSLASCASSKKTPSYQAPTTPPGSYIPSK